MGFGVGRYGGINDVNGRAIVDGQIAVRGVVYGVVPIGEEHYAMSAGHVEKGGGKLAAVFEGGGEAVIAANLFHGRRELLFNIAVEMEKIYLLQIGNGGNFLHKVAGIQNSAAGFGKLTDGKAILHGGVELVAYDNIQLSRLKLGQKGGQGRAFQRDINGRELPGKVFHNPVIKHGGIPGFGAAELQNTAGFAEGILNVTQEIMVVIHAVFQEMIHEIAGGSGLQGACFSLQKDKAKFLFKLGNALADGGLGDEKCACGFGKRALFNKRQKTIYLRVGHCKSPLEKNVKNKDN